MANLLKFERREMMNKTNNKLRSQFVLFNVRQKDVAAEMGINKRVFNNKLFRRTINGYKVYFTEEQKQWLAKRFNMDVNDIE
jgi:hypothetical protein